MTRAEADAMIAAIDAAITEGFANGKRPTLSYTMGGVTKQFEGLSTLRELREYYESIGKRAAGSVPVARVAIVKARVR